MPRRLALPLLATALLLGGGCYQDDTSGPATHKPLAKVLLTDAPFPYDSVSSVNLHVVRIEASTQMDTSGGDWVVIAEPRQTFDLLQLQQGTTAILGEGQIPAGEYHAIRMTIDTSLSSIRSPAGQIPVNWNNYSGSNDMPLYASVDYPVNVSSEGAEIVIDFDLGRSFLWDLYGTREFTLFPWLRAISTAATGAIAGTVTSDYNGPVEPVPNASVTVCSRSPCDSQSATNVVASSRSDNAGHYKVAFVRAGTYTVQIERADHPWLDPVIRPTVGVTTGDTASLSVVLPRAGSGGAYIKISGPTSVGVGGTIILTVAVGDASGHPVVNPVVTWTSDAPAIAEVASGADSVTVVTGHQAGFATITATSGKLSDAIAIQVLGSPGAPVASVTVQPASANLAVGDSVYFTAEVRDSAGTLLSGRPVSWFSTDSSVFVIQFQGGTNPIAIVRPTGVGSALLRATSEGRTGQATITVGPSAPVATVTVVPGSASLTGGDNATFTAQLRDAAGNILSNRSVSWSSTDASIVEITSVNGPSATILARAAGLASLRATSEGKTGEASISVAAPAPVATVTVVPNTADLAVGDSGVTFRADLRDAAGNLLTNRAVSWSASDNSIISVSGSGAQVLVQPRAVGSAVLRATSEGKTGQATITVH